MRLPFPERVPLGYVVCFAGILSAVQLLQGTDPGFSLCSFLFIVIAAFAFNIAGGLTRPSGGYIFFYSTLAVIVGIFWKAFIGERADSDLLQPLLTIQASLGGIVAMCFAAFVSRRLARKPPLLPNLADENLRQASIGCLITGLCLTVILTVTSHEGGSVLSILSQLNGFLPLAMILGIIYEIRKSHGTRSVNLLVFIAGGTLLFVGLISFSKQGIFSVPLCWILAAASQRYKVTRYQAIGFMLACAFMVYYLVPYSQYGRDFRVYPTTESDSGTPITATEAFIINFDTTVTLLAEPVYVRQQYEQAAVPGRVDDVPAYFGTPQGFFDRLQMLSMDDAIINVTEQRGRFGLAPIVWDFENFVPHFLWPGKPTLRVGNLYAHEIGMISPDDLTTGISFSPIGEAFHIARWVGIFLIAPILWIMLFTLFDSLCGDIRQYPWGLLVLVLFGHVAPEGGFGSLIYMFWFGAIAVVFAAWSAIYVMPLIGFMMTAGKGGRLRSAVTVRSIPRRLPSVPPS